MTKFDLYLEQAENNPAGLNRKQLIRIQNIAMGQGIEILERGGLGAMNNDREDFPEISIWSIQRMLEFAYKAGLEDAGKEI